jgi:hypothetical protein
MVRGIMRLLLPDQPMSLAVRPNKANISKGLVGNVRNKIFDPPSTPRLMASYSTGQEPKAAFGRATITVATYIAFVAEVVKY